MITTSHNPTRPPPPDPFSLDADAGLAGLVPGTELDFLAVADATELGAAVDDLSAVLAEDPALGAADFAVDDLAVEDLSDDGADAFLGAGFSSFAGDASVFFGSVGSAIGKSRSKTSVGSFYQHYRMP